MPSRTIHTGDGVAWLHGAQLGPEHAIITSLPDSSEVPALGFDGWRAWFSDVSRLICERLHDDAVALFFQTDVKREGTWVDKAYLVQRGAEAAGSACLFHKVVCRAPAGLTTFGRPAYAHLIAFSRRLRLDVAKSTADVLPTLGKMTWARAMGLDACHVACDFVLTQTACRVVVDPFCGLGSVLAVANAKGMDAVGVELSRKRAEKAQALTLPVKRA